MKTFYVTDEQEKQIDEWDKCKNEYHVAIGGGI
ncbi:hypothetical protein PAAL109150_05880 [Paenibacillus alkaliterrae]